MTTEQRAYIQDLADKAFAQFKGVIMTGRAGKLKKPLAEIANGKVYIAGDAKDLGLVDDIGYLADACDYAAKKASLSKPTVVRIQEPKGLLAALAGDEKTNLDGGSASVKVGGVNVNITDLVELTTPRLMYLWRGQ
jgi:protease-4